MADDDRGVGNCRALRAMGRLIPAPMVTVVRALAWLAVAAGLVVTPATAEEPLTNGPAAIGPQQVMSDLSARLFDTLNKESAVNRHGADTIVPLLDQLLAPHFDMEYAAQLVLGLHWRSATPDQRHRFAVVLYQRLLRTYAGAVAEWTPDRVKQQPLRADPAALQVTVHTRVRNARDEIVSVDFRLRQTVEGWKIFDVVVDGVSYVRTYHDDTYAEVSEKGLDATIARLSRTGTAEHPSSSRAPAAH
jgi:phospholipid transport system substrate-binding protein